MKRSSLLIVKMGTVILFFLLCVGLTGLGGAQEKYPTREITIIAGHPAGVSVDMVNRSLCGAASKILGENIIVMNKPGAMHAVAMVALKNAKPDGYTIALLESGPASAQLVKDVPYDFLKDFRFIMQALGYQHGIVVQASAPWKTIQELILYAKENPGKVRVGHILPGSAHHLAMERLSMKTGVKFNLIPFGDSSTALTNLLGGHVEVACTASTWLPYVEAGKLRLLAVAGADEKRMAQFPSVPTLMELYGIDMPGFAIVGGPKGLPPHVVDTLHRAFKKALEDPAFVSTAEKFTTPVVYRGPEDSTKYVHEFFDTLGPVVEKLGLSERKK